MGTRMETTTYEAPAFQDHGTLADLTAQRYNKVGNSPDTLSDQNPDVVGSYVPLPL
jgi:hypothetical protein